MTATGLKTIPAWRGFEGAVAAVHQALEPGAG